MKTTINTIILALTLITTSVVANSKPYAVFNPLAMFNAAAQKADSAFYNYGNRGYDFVAESINTPEQKAPKHIAILNKSSNKLQQH